MIRIIKEEEPSKPSTRISTEETAPSQAALRHTEPKKLAAMLRGELDWVVMKCLEKQRDRRYETASGLARDIQRYLSNDMVEARPASAGYRFKKFVSRHKGQVAAVALILVALLAGIVGTAWGLFREDKANTQLAKKIDELAEEQTKVQARFELAQKAIAALHTGVSEDFLLKSDQFKELRNRLLGQAADFYKDLEKLLEGQTDTKSRRLLAEGYFQLAELMGKTGSQSGALDVQRKALAIRRALAKEPGADVEMQLDVARSLGATGNILYATGDLEGALREFAEQEDVARLLEIKFPIESVRTALAQSLNSTSWTLYLKGKSDEALLASEKAVKILDEVSKINPNAAAIRFDLASSLMRMGTILPNVGKWQDAFSSLESARLILKKLADDHPTVVRYRHQLAVTTTNTSACLFDVGNFRKTLATTKEAISILQQPVDGYPGLIQFQHTLALDYLNSGRAMGELGMLLEAKPAFETAMKIWKNLVEASPTEITYQYFFAFCSNEIGKLQARTGNPEKSFEAHEKAKTLLQSLSEKQPTFHWAKRVLANTNENISKLLTASGKYEEALSVCHKALAIRQKLKEEQPNVTWTSEELSATLISLAKVQRQMVKLADALVSIRRAIAFLEQLPTRTPRNTYNLACCYALLAGISTMKEAGIRLDDGANYSNIAMKFLRQAFDGGYDSVSNLRVDISLDSLRTREDFKKLLSEQEKKFEDKMP
ncbi:tetratricopeptide repeat protein [Telmatocola sphagniphila]|uniref:Tetratricopeptide repeat protein n=1 Tax=Telmatocola sphagniphila TaxID=1123043 RepID=A0A8E6EWC0_9BACT|nr:tetratricopeptide repeat protein [Telmatocola sphagniphila]QVL33835.1 tetratricopeptide repeat protein [Telmatocola sphagniphila]